MIIIAEGGQEEWAHAAVDARSSDKGTPGGSGGGSGTDIAVDECKNSMACRVAVPV